MERRGGLGGILLVAALAGGLGFWGGRLGSAPSAPPSAAAPGPAADHDRPVASRADLAEDEKATIALFEEASPSVVYITSIALRRDRLPLNVLEIPQGTGSGFVWDRQGHVVTNFHVIRERQRRQGDARRPGDLATPSSSASRRTRTSPC